MMCMFALHTLASVEHVENVNRKKRISRQIYQNRVAPNHFSFKFCAQSQSSSELIWIYLWVCVCVSVICYFVWWKTHDVFVSVVRCLCVCACVFVVVILCFFSAFLPLFSKHRARAPLTRALNMCLWMAITTSSQLTKASNIKSKSYVSCVIYSVYLGFYFRDRPYVWPYTFLFLPFVRSYFSSSILVFFYCASLCYTFDLAVVSRSAVSIMSMALLLLPLFKLIRMDMTFFF